MQIWFPFVTKNTEVFDDCSPYLLYQFYLTEYYNLPRDKCANVKKPIWFWVGANRAEQQLRRTVGTFTNFCISGTCFPGWLAERDDSEYSTCQFKASNARRACRIGSLKQRIGYFSREGSLIIKCTKISDNKWIIFVSYITTRLLIDSLQLTIRHYADVKTKW